MYVLFSMSQHVNKSIPIAPFSLLCNLQLHSSLFNPPSASPLVSCSVTFFFDLRDLHILSKSHPLPLEFQEAQHKLTEHDLIPK